MRSESTFLTQLQAFYDQRSLAQEIVDSYTSLKCDSYDVPLLKVLGILMGDYNSLTLRHRPADQIVVELVNNSDLIELLIVDLEQRALRYRDDISSRHREEIKELFPRFAIGDKF